MKCISLTTFRNETLNLICQKTHSVGIWQDCSVGEVLATQMCKPDNLSLIPEMGMKAERGVGEMAQWL